MYLQSYKTSAKPPNDSASLLQKISNASRNPCYCQNNAYHIVLDFQTLSVLCRTTLYQSRLKFVPMQTNMNVTTSISATTIRTTNFSCKYNCKTRGKKATREKAEGILHSIRHLARTALPSRILYSQRISTVGVAVSCADSFPNRSPGTLLMSSRGFVLSSLSHPRRTSHIRHHYLFSNP